MTRPPSPLSSTARPARRSLAALAAETTDVATTVEESRPAAPSPPAGAPSAPSRSAKYPSATVYLPRRAIRLIKEIGLEENRRISDILAEAIDEYLTRRGHASLKQLSE
jgi:hypothetical protein